MRGGETFHTHTSERRKERKRGEEEEEEEREGERERERERVSLLPPRRLRRVSKAPGVSGSFKPPIYNRPQDSLHPCSLPAGL